MDTDKKVKLGATTIAALAALGIGGAAAAQAGTSTAPPAQVSTSTTSVADTDNVQDQSGADDATEGPETEAAEHEAPGTETNDQGGDQTPAYQSSATAPNGTDETGTKASESDEAAALISKAAITADEASAAANRAVPGTVNQVELDNENGQVVYSVEINTAKGTVDVKVDAGNGKVLYQDSGEDGESGSND
jgi:uncharacterized membrane protein YkoI